MPDSDRCRLICGPVSVSFSVASYSSRSTRSASLHRVFGAAHAEHVAAIGDLHAEAQFDLAQMFVERAAQIGQAFAVVGFEREIALASSHAAIQRRSPRARWPALSAADMQRGRAANCSSPR